MSKKKEKSAGSGAKVPFTSRLADVLRAVGGKPTPHNFTSAVICAAGSSTRMGGDTTKQFLELDGIPVVVRTLQAYQAATCIHEIVVVAKEDEIPLYEGMKERYGLSKLTKIVPGGATRQESSRKGSDEIDPKSKYIAIADGARCLTTPAEIDAVCHAAYSWEAASAGVPASDTVKIVDTSAFVESTTERGRTWLAQTPQVFRVPIYRAAAYACRDEGFRASDDNAMVEHLHIPVHMVRTRRENIKITEPMDLILAHAVLESRRAAEGGDEPGLLPDEKTTDGEHT